MGGGCPSNDCTPFVVRAYEGVEDAIDFGDNFGDEYDYSSRWRRLDSEENRAASSAVQLNLGGIPYQDDGDVGGG